MCKHKWVQVRDFYVKSKSKPDEIIGIYLFCENCHMLCSVEFANAPNYTYKAEEG